SIDSLDQRIHVENPHDEIGRLAETLNLLLARLETAVHEIRRFTADASHEIRTPLAALRAEADLALLRVRTPQEYQQALQIIVDEATRLGRLADQLLDLSRSDAGAVNRALRPVSLTAILQDTVEHLQVLAEQRGLQLKLLSGPCGDVPGDEFRLGMVCSNLIENAIKYSRPGGKIRVSCRPEGQQTVLEVSDDGIGITAEHLPRVFDRFYRADGSRSSAGAGLGLSIAQSIIRAHHGQITIASEPGQGTVVSVRLPSVEGSVVRDSNRRSVEPLLEEVSVQA
ncbi:MAG: sensor histidine kinase, partial [Planctomyces sp.]